ncbi:MAG TPA: hypothetical protein VIY09_00500, partial [Rhizomicrobium sp.]
GAGVWLLFELVPTKLPHYILPAYPALALLCALWVASRDRERKWETRLRYLASAQFALVAAALAGLCIFLPAHFGGTALWPVYAGVAPGLAISCAAVVFLLRRRLQMAAMLGVVSALAFDLLLAFGVAPQLHELWLSRRAAELVADHRGTSSTPVVVAGYVEPSLVFLLDSGAEIESGSAAATTAAAHEGLALIEGRVRPRFLSGLQNLGATATSLGAISGLDYSTGRKQQITLYRVTPAPLGSAR